MQGHLSEVSKQDVPKTDRHIHGGIHRRHTREVSQGRAPRRPPSLIVQGLERLQDEVKPNQMRFRGLRREVLGFHSQQL